MSDAAPADPLLEIRNLRTWYPARGRRGDWVKAVDDVSFAIRRGETLGLVGESGCGKTTLGRSILRLEKARSGQVIFEGEDVLRASPRRLKRMRRDMQVIFQDPHASLDPRMTVRQLIGEGLVVQGLLGRDERDARVSELAAVVGLRREYLDRYPHEFSGGQRQRIGIARALALRPKFVLADEPVSALDLSVQSQVLNLLAELQREFGLTYLFIAHDLSVVEYISDRVGVMYLGRIVELASAETLYDDPRMPYTQALLSAIPGSEAETGTQAHRAERRRAKPARPALRLPVPHPLLVGARHLRDDGPPTARDRAGPFRRLPFRRGDTHPREHVKRLGSVP